MPPDGGAGGNSRHRSRRYATSSSSSGRRGASSARTKATGGILVASILIINPLLNASPAMGFPHRYSPASLIARQEARSASQPRDVIAEDNRKDRRSQMPEEQDDAEHSSARRRAEKGKMKEREDGVDPSSWIYGLVDPAGDSSRIVSKRDAAASSTPPQPDPAQDPNPLHPYGMHFIDDLPVDHRHFVSTPTIRASNTSTSTTGSLISSVPSSWDPPQRSFWFQKKAIIIVSIFLAIFIVLFIGAAVFLHDRRYDLAADETDEEAIQRVLDGRHEVQRKRGRERGDARREVTGEKEEGEGEGTGEKVQDAVSAKQQKRKLGAKRPVTRWIKATVMAPAALFRHTSRNSSTHSSSSVDHSSSGSRSIHSSSSSMVEQRRDGERHSSSPSHHPRSSSESARRSIRSTSASISSGNLRQRHRRTSHRQRPRLGDGRTEERVLIEYDDNNEEDGGSGTLLPSDSHTTGSNGSGAVPAATTTSNSTDSRHRSSSFIAAPPSPPPPPPPLSPPALAPQQNGRLDASDFSAAEEIEGRRAAGVVGSEEVGETSPAEEVFPPAYIPARNSVSAAAGQSAAAAAATAGGVAVTTSAAALAAAATTEQKTDVALMLSSAHGRGRPGQEEERTEEEERRLHSAFSQALYSPSAGAAGSSHLPPAAEQARIAHVATDDKTILGALSAAASRPEPSIASSASAPLYAPGATPVVTAASAHEEAQPSAPMLDVDQDGFERMEEEVEMPSSPTSGKGKAPSLLPQPPAVHKPTFSPFDQPYTPLWPPSSGSPSIAMPSPSAPAPSAPPIAATAPAPSQGAMEKEQEAERERALLASSPGDYAAMTHGATLPAYQRLAAGAPSAPPIEALQDAPEPRAPPSSSSLEPEPTVAADGEEEATAEERIDSEEAEHPRDAEGCPQV